MQGQAGNNRQNISQIEQPTTLATEHLTLAIEQPTTVPDLHEQDIEVRDDLSIMSMKASCDAHALSLMPDDIPLRRDVYPVVVVGDGNCLPRVGSILAFGSEERHAEIRKRIAIELKNHEATYLSDEHLTSGSNKKLTKSMMAHFSEEYCGRPMAPDEVQRIYRAEIESITKPASYMGLWQIALWILFVPIIFAETWLTPFSRILHFNIRVSHKKHKIVKSLGLSAKNKGNTVLH